MGVFALSEQKVGPKKTLMITNQNALSNIWLSPADTAKALISSSRRETTAVVESPFSMYQHAVHTVDGGTPYEGVGIKLIKGLECKDMDAFIKGFYNLFDNAFHKKGTSHPIVKLGNYTSKTVDFPRDTAVSTGAKSYT